LELQLELSLTLGQKEAADKNEFTNVFTLIVCISPNQGGITVLLLTSNAQCLYPVALAAGIFSMQQGAIPFTQTPKTFAITVFIIMIMVSATQIFGIHALPWLRKMITWWIERCGRQEGKGIMAGAEVKKEDEVGIGGGQERTRIDEESVTPEMSRGKSRTWMSWVTGSTVVGTSDEQ
jgi:hypothetical protein